MQNVPSRQQTAPSRWVLLTAVGIFGIFLGLGIRQVVAQTFSDPTCTPPGCNKSTPLFLQPENLDAVQIVRTPVQIGQVAGTGAGNKDLVLYGNVTLSQPGKTIKTATSYTGTVMDFLSNSSTPALLVSNSGSGAGIQATATSGNAIYASNVGGNAALFDGPVVVNNTTGTGLTVNGPLTLTGASGTLTVAQNLTVSGTLTVNGQNVGAVANSVKDQNKGDGILYRTIDATGLAGTTSMNLDLTQASYLGPQHAVVSVQAMYDADATNNGAVYNWRATNDATYIAEYQECNLSGFYGHLILTYPTAPAAGTAFRILVGYRAVATTCGVPVYSIAATPTGGNAPATGARTTFTLNTTISSGSGTMTYMWDFGEDAINDIDCQSTDPNGTCPGTAPAGNVTFVAGGTVQNPRFQFAAGTAAGVKTPKLTIENGAGTGAPATANVSIYRVNMAIAQRAGGSPYRVNVTDTSQGAGGSYTCNVDLKNNGTTEKTITSPTTCSDTATTGGDWDHATGSYTAVVWLAAAGCNYDGVSPGICDRRTVNYSIAFQCNTGTSLCGTGTLCCDTTVSSCCTSTWSCGGTKPTSGSGPACIAANCTCGPIGDGGSGPPV